MIFLAVPVPSSSRGPDFFSLSPPLYSAWLNKATEWQSGCELDASGVGVLVGSG